MKKINIKITDQSIVPEELIGDEDYMDMVELCNGLSLDKSLYAEITIKKAIKNYPNSAAFYNYLVVNYFHKGKTKKAFELNEKVMKQFPDYLFAKTTEVVMLLEEEVFDEGRIKELLGQEEFDIRNIVASDHTVFHVSQVISYYGTVIKYYLRKGAIEQAKTYLAYLLSEPLIGEDNEKVEGLAEEIMMKRGERRQLLIEKTLELEPEASFPTVAYEQVTAPPSLNHDELKWFYEADMLVERDLLKTTMALPKDSLINDLILILEDSIKRFDYFEDMAIKDTLDFEQQFFPNHAFMFLSMLAPESKKAIPVILDVLRQGDSFIYFWFDDDFLEDGGNWLYPILKDEMGILSTFIREAHLSQWVRGILVELVVQIALHEPERKQEIIDWTLNQIDFFEEKLQDRTIYSPLTMSKLIEALDKLRAKEHIEKIRDIYQKEMLNFRYSGDLKNVEDTIALAPDPRDKKPLPKDIFDFYDGDYLDQAAASELSQTDTRLLEILEDPVEGYFMSIMADQLGIFDDDDDDDTYGYDDDDDDDEEDIAPTTVIRTSPKVGRNDPCPCGSGKKYKKCCLNKG